jgi:hypothetical protein
VFLCRLLTVSLGQGGFPESLIGWPRATNGSEGVVDCGVWAATFYCILSVYGTQSSFVKTSQTVRSGVSLWPAGFAKR